MKLRFLAMLALAVALSSASAQTLAHKGWAGNGLTVEPWYASAVFYELDPISFQDANGDGFGDLRGIADWLPYLQQLGVDALILSPFSLQAPGAAQPFDPAYGTPDDFDHLEQEAALRHIRIVVDLPVDFGSSADDTAAKARFWLSRGVAGLRLVHAPGEPAPTATQRADRLRELRRILAGYSGQRILIWDAGPATATAAVARLRSAPPVPPAAQPELEVSNQLTFLTSLSSLRSGLLSISSRALLHTDSPETQRSWDRLADGTHDLPRARLLATALLAGPAVPLLFFGQEIGMSSTPAGGGPGDPTPMQWGQLSAADHGFTTGSPWLDFGRNNAVNNVAGEDADPASLLNWYRQLAALHHSSAALRSGSFDLLPSPSPDLLLWVRRPRATAGTATAAPVLVALNLSARPAFIALGSLLPELRRLGISGTLLKTLARSPAEPSGTPMMSAIELDPFGAYVGEIRTGTGLESVVIPVRPRRHR